GQARRASLWNKSMLRLDARARGGTRRMSFVGTRGASPCVTRHSALAASGSGSILKLWQQHRQPYEKSKLVPVVWTSTWPPRMFAAENHLEFARWEDFQQSGWMTGMPRRRYSGRACGV